MQFLYRFRRTEALIGEFKELEEQEIYFSPPDELNDPVEGFKDMFWLGDKIIWKNFIKHYLLCLESICVTFLIDKENFLISPINIPVFKTANDFPTLAYKKLYEEICELFFKNHLAVKLPYILASRNTPIKKNELYVFFKRVHTHALNTIFTVYENNNLIPKRLGNHLFPPHLKDVIGASVNWANNKELDQSYLFRPLSHRKSWHRKSCPSLANHRC